MTEVRQIKKENGMLGTGNTLIKGLGIGDYKQFSIVGRRLKEKRQIQQQSGIRGCIPPGKSCVLHQVKAMLHK